ncbi:MAG: hypothetical protein IJ678_01715 [Kiritimatiellae bacterium]|nr:hypothetical protein [Kiritimatiellia bacterium]
MQNKRETLGSRLGFILISAGCAIGIGNVWRFPWLAGRYGGGWFVVAYLAFLVLLGLPVMTMEFAMGRAAGRSPALIYQSLGRPGWGWEGFASEANAGRGAKVKRWMRFYCTWILPVVVLAILGIGLRNAALG